MYDFTYHKPRSVAEAAKLASGEAKLLAGGMTLIPTLKQRLARPDALGYRVRMGDRTARARLALTADVRTTVNLHFASGWRKLLGS